MIRTTVIAALCLAGVSLAQAQGHQPRLRLLRPADFYFDATDMGGDSSRSVTTVANPLQHTEVGGNAELTIAFATGMDRRDTMYTLVLNGYRFDSLFTTPTPHLVLEIAGHSDSVIGRPSVRGLKALRQLDHIWYVVSVAQLREIAQGKPTSIRLVGQERLGAWTLDEPSVALRKRLLGIPGEP